MAPTPSIPQKVINFSAGEALEGSEIIAVRIVRGAQAADPQITAEGVWEVTVPQQPSRPLDLTDGKEFADDGWRGAGGALVRRLNKVVEHHPVRAKKHVVQVELPEEVTAENVRSLAIGMTVGGHTFKTTNEKRGAKVRRVHVVLPGAGKGNAGDKQQQLADAVHAGAALGAATCLSRDLSNTPSNVKSPEWLAKKAKKLVGDMEGVKVRLRDAEWLKTKGFGGILAVGQGSSRPPMLIELVWDPEEVGKKRKRPTVLLVGKGVTFDTGGVSIKPSKGMETMITDMTGGASVIAAFRELARQQTSRKVVALIPTAENMVGGNSYRPGDVVEHYGGITTEVANTDAEGRMLLADAISYGTRKYKPAMVVSLATLTGAAKVALGLRTGAVFAPEWGAGVKLSRRGSAVGERWWPLPMPDYVEDAVDSAVADVRQAPGGPGATTAAMFLRRFTRGVPFVHLDIAGPGRAESTYDEVTPLGTGFGARTLVQWLRR
ncbi:MAG TPA: leucyl aminopeptidase family protein [Candidatus Corynebacterium gallistercoris]|uniref:Probable cytosol aminopeptidase n=1 Tax=Candidatus Corynebacterium gallistercoris TaxID=2838530 RepID=A0A9D1RZX5_9CORY|nr:leucyl aminopeptidase family protein [Candidatus Corynebacterium gallistercoris]